MYQAVTADFLLSLKNKLQKCMYQAVTADFCHILTKNKKSNCKNVCIKQLALFFNKLRAYFWQSLKIKLQKCMYQAVTNICPLSLKSAEVSP